MEMINLTFGELLRLLSIKSRSALDMNAPRVVTYVTVNGKTIKVV
jgi:hypothetical protein